MAKLARRKDLKSLEGNLIRVRVSVPALLGDNDCEFTHFHRPRLCDGVRDGIRAPPVGRVGVQRPPGGKRPYTFCTIVVLPCPSCFAISGSGIPSRTACTARCRQSCCRNPEMPRLAGCNQRAPRASEAWAIDAPSGSSPRARAPGIAQASMSAYVLQRRDPRPSSR